MSQRRETSAEPIIDFVFLYKNIGLLDNDNNDSVRVVVRLLWCVCVHTTKICDISKKLRGQSKSHIALRW